MGIKEAILTYTEEKGIKKGIEQGIERGIEQGIEEGLAQGDEKRIATALQNMYDRKVSVEDMASFLGISIEKVSLVLEGLGLTVPDVKE